MTVINTNVNALMTQASLVKNSRSLGAAMEQLSTGLRINSSKDDAAGLSIATKMTQQIGALDQAVRNAGDAISLIQTTEGATVEISSMLQRMRELAIQAVNDTNSGDQRGYLDLEFQQLKKEIVRIADMTEWNGFPILNGTTGTPMEQVAMNQVTSASYEKTMEDALTNTNAYVPGGVLDPLEEGDLTIEGVTIGTTDGMNYDVVSPSENADASAISIAAAINMHTHETKVTALVNANTVTGQPMTAISGGIEGYLYINGKRTQYIQTPGGDPESVRTVLMAHINELTGATGVVASASGPAEKSGITLTASDGRNIEIGFEALTFDGSSRGINEVEADANALNADGSAMTDVQAQNAQFEALTGLRLGVHVGTVTLQAESSDVEADGSTGITLGGSGAGGVPADVTNLTSPTSSVVTVLKEVTDASSLAMPRVGRMTFQVGASASQSITIDLADFGKKGPITGGVTSDVDKLVPSIRIDTPEGAAAVLAALDSAMDKVNATRGSMGAVMNRLEHAIDNLTNVSTNTTQSRSQIQDADYAKASSDLARAQIIQQAATAVLAQANQSQQSVLKLLQ